MLKSTILALFLLFTPVHDWYPIECCGGSDCHPIPCEEVSQGKEGYYWKEIGPFKNPMASPDGHCHACHSGSTPLCLYILQTT